MKDLFLLDPTTVFLNHGSFGACPEPVFAEYQRWQRELERNPVEFLGRRSGELLHSARGALAGYLGTSADRLIFIPNATHGVNTVARSLRLSPGDEVLTTDQEYGACDNAWEQVCRAAGAKYVRAEIPLPFRRQEFVDRIFARVSTRTRVLYLSQLTSTTALIFPVAELCRRAREAGLLTVVDGAHAPGHLPLHLDSLGADFYTGNCHKWLCAPKGSAFLWARPEHAEVLHGLATSWGYSAEIQGHVGFDAYTGSTVLERRHQWQGTRDLAAFLAVPAAIEFQRNHDWEAVRARCHALAARTARNVAARTGLEPLCRDDDFGQMVAMPIPWTDPMRLKNRLFEEHRIEIPVTSHRDRMFVRLSVQAYNSEADLEALEAALARELRW